MNPLASRILYMYERVHKYIHIHMYIYIYTYVYMSICLSYAPMHSLSGTASWRRARSSSTSAAAGRRSDCLQDWDAPNKGFIMIPEFNSVVL